MKNYKDFEIRKLQQTDYETGKKRYVLRKYEIYENNKLVSVINFLIDTPEIFNTPYHDVPQQEEDLIHKLIDNSLKQDSYYFKFITSNYLEAAPNGL